MTEKLTPEEVSEITGEDIEDVSDAEHPRESLEEDTEGTGVEGPDLESARFDTEIEDEDRDDVHLRGLDFDKLTEEDADFYLQMAALRRELKEQGVSKGLMKKIDQLADDVRMETGELIGDEKDREKFLAMINNKLTVISLETQMGLKKK